MQRRRYLRTLVASGTVAAGLGTDSLGPSVVQPARAQADTEWTKQAKLTADSVALGVSVAMSGDGTTAVIGDVDDRENGVRSGAAYVYTRNGGSWSQQAKLIPDDGNRLDAFGDSVAVSNDGTTALIGAYADNGPYGERALPGSAYVFSRDGDAWSQQTKLVADDRGEDDRFGESVAISSDGTTAVIGASADVLPNGNFAGSAYVFSRDGDAWSQQTKLVADDGNEDDRFGWSVAVSNDGTTALIGGFAVSKPAYRAGAAYVFTRNGGSWSQQTKLTAEDFDEGDRFGFSVAMSGDGTTAVIGAEDDEDPNGVEAGSAYVFSRDDDAWSQQTKLVADDGDEGDGFGWSVAVSSDGTTALIGAFSDDDSDNSEGSAYVFSRDGDAWSQQTKLVADDDGDNVNAFGHSVAVSSDGTTALIGDFSDDDSDNSGRAYVFSSGGGSDDDGDATGCPAVDGTDTTDPDGDGLCEDIDGDGSFDIFDVQSFLDNFGGTPVQENAGKFNFDGDDGVNIFDVQALLKEL